MSVEEKLKFFQKELDDRIADVSKKRDLDKAKAFGLKVFAVVFAASITVLLGIKVDENVASIFKNVALILGAIITIINAVEAFYDYRSLWIRRTVTLAHLDELKRDLNLYVIGSEQNDIDPKTLNNLADRYERILADDLKAWLKLREGSTPANEPLIKKT